MKRCRSHSKGYRCILKQGHKSAHHYENDWGAFSGGTFVCAGTEQSMKNKVENENREPRMTAKWTARALTPQERLWYC